MGDFDPENDNFIETVCRCEECGEELDQDCQGVLRCANPDCDEYRPCLCCSDGEGYEI